MDDNTDREKHKLTEISSHRMDVCCFNTDKGIKYTLVFRNQDKSFKDKIDNLDFEKLNKILNLIHVLRLSNFHLNHDKLIEEIKNM